MSEEEERPVHKLFESVAFTSSTASAMRCRAFCRCGWADKPVGDEDEMRRRYEAHVAEASS